jgi:hypothetical protein
VGEQLGWPKPSAGAGAGAWSVSRCCGLSQGLGRCVAVGCCIAGAGDLCQSRGRWLGHCGAGRQCRSQSLSRVPRLGHLAGGDGRSLTNARAGSLGRSIGWGLSSWPERVQLAWGRGPWARGCGDCLGAPPRPPASRLVLSNRCPLTPAFLRLCSQGRARPTDREAKDASASLSSPV